MPEEEINQRVPLRASLIISTSLLLVAKLVVAIYLVSAMFQELADIGVVIIGGVIALGLLITCAVDARLIWIAWLRWFLRDRWLKLFLLSPVLNIGVALAAGFLGVVLGGATIFGAVTGILTLVSLAASIAAIPSSKSDEEFATRLSKDTTSPD